MTDSKCHLLLLSDELLLLIVQHLDRHDDIPNFWMTCKKLKAISNVSIALRYASATAIVLLPSRGGC